MLSVVLLFLLPALGNSCIEPTTPKPLCKPIGELYSYGQKLSVKADLNLFQNETMATFNCKVPKGYDGVHVIADYGVSIGGFAWNNTYAYYNPKCTLYCDKSNGHFIVLSAEGHWQTIYQVACFAYKEKEDDDIRYHSWVELAHYYKMKL